MNIFLTALLISAAAFILLLAFALCRAASDTDDELERIINEKE